MRVFGRVWGAVDAEARIVWSSHLVGPSEGRGEGRQLERVLAVLDRVDLARRQHTLLLQRELQDRLCRL